MSDLLLELLTEEIPARMQGLAARELNRLVEVELKDLNLTATSIETFVTPRRLTLAVAGLPTMQAGSVEERRGPRVGAPDQAVQGFLKSAGLTSLDQCEKRATDKGEFWFATIKRPGRATKDVLPVLLLEVIRALPWPKSMRFPAADFRWVRPIQSAICLFDGKVLKLDLGAVPVGNKTAGHRFLSPAAFAVRDLKDYRAKLARAKVVLDAAERRRRIETGLSQAATKAGLKVQPDEVLLEEVTGLVEWPAVLMGTIDPSFMDLPPEVLTTAMRTHQKYFATLDKSGRLAPRFLLVSNMDAAGGGKAIVAGNERVLKARLADARFFWDQDRKHKLEDWLPKLNDRIFHAQLGKLSHKVERVARLAVELADRIPGADKAKVKRAAELAKADLSSGMVSEFPELQGVMGRYYALAEGEDTEVVNAIAEHYSPLGPSDHCPKAPVSVAVALADKIDSLVAFFSINEKPTGSKDPFALRRAALGVIRLILENGIRGSLKEMYRNNLGGIDGQRKQGQIVADPSLPSGVAIGGLPQFFEERLKVLLREQGVRHDLISAVFGHRGDDDLVRIVLRVRALQTFLGSDDGANLLTAYRRAANIVRIEGKKDGKDYTDEPLAFRQEESLKSLQHEERKLRLALAYIREKMSEPLQDEDFVKVMSMLATLRKPIDDFFDKVTVNVSEPAVRLNRLRLLAGIVAVMNSVADFSQIEG